MPRKATGQLERRGDRFFARVRVVVDGKVARPWIDLDTTDETIARARMVELAAKGAADRTALPAEPPKPAGLLFQACAEEWLDARRARGVAMVDSEDSWLRRHVFDDRGTKRRPEPRFGDLPLTAITSKRVRAILENVAAKGRSNQTLVHVRATLHRIFDQAWRDDLIDANPVLKVKAPLKANEVKKPRAVLTDEEFVLYMTCDKADAEVQLMALTSRVLGGARTIDVISWDWTMIDVTTFRSCFVPRTKTGAPQKLELPEMLGSRLRRRWEAAGRPDVGPVFPVRRGPRKGEARRRRGVSFAKRLRRDLKLAGVTRRELFVETPVSKPVDFHQFRAAFGTRAAEELTERHAMHLGGWSSSQAFGRYVRNSARLQTIPASILPVLRSGSDTDTPEENVANPGAGHGVRTRDPQLGKLTTEARSGFIAADPASGGLGSDEPGPPEALIFAGQSLLVLSGGWDAMETALLAIDLDGEAFVGRGWS